MEEGVECMVELVNDRREVAVITKSEEERAENSLGVFGRIVHCVMEVKAVTPSNLASFCLILWMRRTSSCSPDNRFDMTDVGKVLICPGP
jgi:hypothetical protein